MRRRLFWLFWLFLSSTSAVVCAAAQQSYVPVEAQLTACQEQLADVRGAVTQIHQPNAAFQAESLVTLNRKLGEAQAREAQQMAMLQEKQRTIDALTKQLTDAQAQQVNDATIIVELQRHIEMLASQASDGAALVSAMEDARKQLAEYAATIGALQQALEALKPAPAKPEG